MISVIICSVNETLLNQCKENVRLSIGAKHEFIIIDNRINNLPITQIYNDAARYARFDILCFLHEDVLFHTYGWGATIIGILNDSESLGMLGICGGVYKAKVPSAWIDIPPSYRRANMKAKNDNGQLEDYVSRDKEGENLSFTVTLDGLCLMMRKNIWQEFKFDEQNLKGFHYYDLDISLRVGTKYKLAVSHEVFAEHLSPGNFGKSWIEETLRFHKRFYHVLPKYIGIENASERNYLESFAMKRFMEKCHYAKSLDLPVIFGLIWNYPLVTIENLIFMLRLKWS